MKIAFFDTHIFERKIFDELNQKYGFEIIYVESKLKPESAPLARGAQVVCSFVNDKVNAECLKKLKEANVGLVALRSAGFNHVDLKAAKELGIQVCRVPGYSPYAVAEYALGLLLCLNRKIHKSYARVRELNFSLDGLMGFDLHGKTVGVIGTGKIGLIFAKAVSALGCKVLAFDKYPVESEGVTYVDMDRLLKESDIISLHVPLTPETRHLICDDCIGKMKENVYIINTGRGGLIDTHALIRGLKSKKIGGVALDVYEEEEDVFFRDLSETGLSDDTLARLLTFPNVLVSSHQAFLTREALTNIASTTLENIKEYVATGKVTLNKVEA